MIDPRLLETLPLLADGDVRGTLHEAHPDFRGPVEALNLEHPTDVQAAHERFRDAGALLHRTNTAAGCFAALEPHGLAGRAEAVNNSGAAVVRGAIGMEGVMMGTLAPLRLPPGRVHPGAAVEERALCEQIIYLSDTGVNVFLLLHLGPVSGALRLLGYVKRLTDAPALVTLGLTPRGTTVDDETPREAAARLRDAGADALALAGALPLDGLPGALHGLLATELPVGVLPGACTPEGGLLRNVVPPPDAFADAVGVLAELGVSILGGCCGVTPAHIAALARRVRG